VQRVRDDGERLSFTLIRNGSSGHVVNVIEESQAPAESPACVVCAKPEGIETKGLVPVARSMLATFCWYDSRSCSASWNMRSPRLSIARSFVSTLDDLFARLGEDRPLRLHVGSDFDLSANRTCPTVVEVLL